MEWWHLIPGACMLVALAVMAVRRAQRTYMNLFDKEEDDGKK